MHPPPHPHTHLHSPHPHPSLQALRGFLFLHPKISLVVLLFLLFLIQWSSGLESGEWHQSLIMNILSVPRVPLSVSEWLVWCLRGLFNGTSNLEPVEGGTSNTHTRAEEEWCWSFWRHLESVNPSLPSSTVTRAEGCLTETEFKLSP